MMETEQIIEKYKEFQDANNGFEELMIFSEKGDLLFSLNPNYITEIEAKSLMEAWLTKQSAVVIGEVRYPILSHEILQFAARNVKGQGALVGTKTKKDNYVVAHLNATSRFPPTIAAINLNRWAWNLL
ncbi:hypothetical protein NEF87_002565 [Candidatus Lokiarchaeum ossiferum]|uniref:Uncharacterized protein n=1 Tax=Candidatus Lokiarchaeum ossiferum TaxID=2951803 RepID=A0ABY6HS93_9ARCH|nr:hypothetical protein NEF87_002565 [Candidatus Lokiarchaeum sp. B-35]